MRCPVCNFHDTKVVDSRLTGDELRIRRRRECIKCEYRFSTFEEVEILDVSVIKRDGRSEPYLREKLERGLRKALEKRSHTSERFKSLVGSIERDIQKTCPRPGSGNRKGELTSQEIGEIVMKRLRQFDGVAYIRFASVYRSFTDVKTFQDEIARLTKRRRVPQS